MPFPLLAAAAGIQGVTSLIGGFLGASAAKKAAAQQKAAQEAAIQKAGEGTQYAVNSGFKGIEQANSAITSGTEAANNYIGQTGEQQKKLYGDMVSGLDPYKTAGTYGLEQMQSKAGTFAFNPKDLENEPGYQFQLAQGNKALANSYAGRGMLQSGAALKAAVGYNQGMAGTAYKDAYQRALSTFNTNQQGYQSLANMGQNANSQAISAGGIYGGQLTSLANMGTSSAMQGAGLKSNVAMQGNQYIGDAQQRGSEVNANLLTGIGNSQAAGTIGGANAWRGGLNGVGNAAMTYGMASMGAENGSGGGPVNYGSYFPWNPGNPPVSGAAPVPNGGGIPTPGLPAWVSPSPAPVSYYE